MGEMADYFLDQLDDDCEGCGNSFRFCDCYVRPNYFLSARLPVVNHSKKGVLMTKMDFSKKHCITYEFRVGFPHVFTAHKMDEKSEAKFSLEMQFPKATNLSKSPDGAGESLKSAAFNAAVEKWGPDKSKWPKGLRLPFKDGDQLIAEGKDHGGYANAVVVRASAKKQPGLIDRQRKPILSEDDFYPGCWARAELAAFAYDTAGNKGVAFTLLNIQKTKDDEKFSGRRAAADVFSALPDEADSSDNPENYNADDDLGFS